MLLAAFVAELIHAFPAAMNLSDVDPEKVILAVLGMIDLSLAGNLVVIVIFSGYENFVSKINTENAEDRPSWMGTLDFSGLKMKLIGSIVAISAISLLRAFMSLSEEGTAVRCAAAALDADPAPDIRGRRACCSPPWIRSATAPRSRASIETPLRKQKGRPRRSGPFHHGPLHMSK